VAHQYLEEKHEEQEDDEESGEIDNVDMDQEEDKLEGDLLEEG
jgi:hypothetical protein